MGARCGEIVVKIGIGIDVEAPFEQLLATSRELFTAGFTSQWASQIFGPDTLTTFAVLGHAIPGLDLGTAVVPIQPRHPSMLGAQARTVQSLMTGRLNLGIGLSHQIVVEGLWGLSYDRPASYMREYLAALAPILRGEAVSVTGERVSATTMGTVGPKDTVAPRLLVAALGPKMLEMTAQLADGTCTWMTGEETIRSYVAPTINAAAEAAGRPRPEIICALPILVTSDVAGTRAFIDQALAVYPTLPSYAAMMEREGATTASDLAIVGSADQVLEKLAALADAGVTEFSANIMGVGADREATLEVLSRSQA